MIDHECINEYNEHQNNFSATVGIIFSVLLILAVILFIYFYKKHKRKKEEESLVKSYSAKTGWDNTNQSYAWMNSTARNAHVHNIYEEINF